VRYSSFRIDAQQIAWLREQLYAQACAMPATACASEKMRLRHYALMARHDTPLILCLFTADAASRAARRHFITHIATYYAYAAALMLFAALMLVAAPHAYALSCVDCLLLR